jgi:hypothetical protein
MIELKKIPFLGNRRNIKAAKNRDIINQSKFAMVLKKTGQKLVFVQQL